MQNQFDFFTIKKSQFSVEQFVVSYLGRYIKLWAQHFNIIVGDIMVVLNWGIKNVQYRKNYSSEKLTKNVPLHCNVTLHYFWCLLSGAPLATRCPYSDFPCPFRYASTGDLIMHEKLPCQPPARLYQPTHSPVCPPARHIPPRPLPLRHVTRIS